VLDMREITIFMSNLHNEERVLSNTADYDITQEPLIIIMFSNFISFF